VEECLACQYVQQMSGSVQAFDPISGGHTCLKQEGAHNIVDSANDALSSTGLR